jgi:DNA repair protein RecO (recombination protein O)
VVTQAQAVQSYPGLRDDLDRLSAGLYLAELSDRFTVEHADATGLFGLLQAALTRLDRGDGQQVVTRTYELALLEATGFRPEWTRCLGCGLDVAADEARWSAVEGGVIGPECLARYPGAGPIDPTALRVLRAYQAQPYEEAGRIRLTDDLAARLEQIMHALMRAVAERELKSAAFVSAARHARVAEEHAGLDEDEGDADIAPVP